MCAAVCVCVVVHQHWLCFSSAFCILQHLPALSPIAATIAVISNFGYRQRSCLIERAHKLRHRERYREIHRDRDRESEGKGEGRGRQACKQRGAHHCVAGLCHLSLMNGCPHPLSALPFSRFLSSPPSLSLSLAAFVLPFLAVAAFIRLPSVAFVLTHRRLTLLPICRPRRKTEKRACSKMFPWGESTRRTDRPTRHLSAVLHKESAVLQISLQTYRTFSLERENDRKTD